MAHSDMNTEAKTIKMSGMNHTEGGWPEHVRTEMVEHKNKFIRLGIGIPPVFFKLLLLFTLNTEWILLKQANMQGGHV